MPWRVGPDQEELHVSTFVSLFHKILIIFKKKIQKNYVDVSSTLRGKQSQDTHCFPFQGHTEQMYDRLHEAEAEV